MTTDTKALRPVQKVVTPKKRGASCCIAHAIDHTLQPAAKKKLPQPRVPT